MNAPLSPYGDGGFSFSVTGIEANQPPKNLHAARDYNNAERLKRQVKERIATLELDDVFDALKWMDLGPEGPRAPRMGAAYTPRAADGEAPRQERFTEDTPASEWQYHQREFCLEAVQALLQACEGRKTEFYEQAHAWLRELPFPKFCRKVLTRSA